MLRLSHGGGVLDPVDGFDNVAGGTPVCRFGIVNGSVSGHRWHSPIAANSKDHTFRQCSRGRHSAFRGWRKNLAAHIDINSDVHEVCAHERIRVSFVAGRQLSALPSARRRLRGP